MRPEGRLEKEAMTQEEKGSLAVIKQKQRTEVQDKEKDRRVELNNREESTRRPCTCKDGVPGSEGRQFERRWHEGTTFVCQSNDVFALSTNLEHALRCQTWTTCSTLTLVLMPRDSEIGCVCKLGVRKDFTKAQRAV